jgi:hypothetical protein
VHGHRGIVEEAKLVTRRWRWGRGLGYSAERRHQRCCHLQRPRIFASRSIELLKGIITRKNYYTNAT